MNGSDQAELTSKDAAAKIAAPPQSYGNIICTDSDLVNSLIVIKGKAAKMGPASAF